MNDETTAVLEAMHGVNPIPQAQVLVWMRSASLETRAVVYQLTDIAWSRVHPQIPRDVQCEFMQSYLLECIGSNPESGDYLHSGFESAWEFAAWLKHMQKVSETEIVERASLELEGLFKRSDTGTRDRIETAALEHVLEDPVLRPYFAHWRSDPVLSPTFGRGLERGEAHESSGG